MRIQSGFTLIELMIVIVVLAIILTLGVPSFRSIIQNNRAVTIANDLVAAVQTARSEALRLRATVSVCRSAGGTVCEDDTDWSVGWIVCSDACAGPTDVIRVWEAVPGNGTVTGPNTGITFRSTGIAAAAGTFTVTLPACSGNEQRSIFVLASGSLNQTRTACP